MAIGIENYPNIDTSDPTNYPHGSIKDDPAGFIGTPVDRETYDDLQQTFRRALTQNNVTPSGLPDNVANGYEYAKAFGLEAWVSGGSLTFTAVGGGSVTVGGGDVIYNKYRRVGKTIYYQLRIVGATISGVVTGIAVTLPFMSAVFPNASFGIPGMYGTANDLYVTLENPFGFGILLNRVGAIAFNTGVNDQNFDINIVAEIA